MESLTGEEKVQLLNAMDKLSWEDVRLVVMYGAELLFRHESSQGGLIGLREINAELSVYAVKGGDVQHVVAILLAPLTEAR